MNAHIHTMSGYSTHADQTDLLRFIAGIPNAPKEVRIVHGDKQAQQALAKQIEKRKLAKRTVLGVET
ncbi:RNA-metabolising metallo-beta-lactamase [Enterovibrio nigricans DSM 22720]|uniref:RNA-metabolising metallo-beta-lactamase n=1 Tax=Enterovibrio nigricans DSM 22720 TaxID=1121868 RepID=A0A1T4VW98_9GAMM|nr:RNA-metabolising metallo-beta-lactamase [Enterovibrio nigricans DSM 22720]